MELNRKKILIEVKELLMIAVCCLPYGFVVNQVLIPHAVIGGGMTGICEIIYFASGEAVPIWLSSLSINLILVIVAVILLGWKTCLRTFYGIFWMTVWLRVFTVPEQPLITDPFMAIILAGILNGAGLGIVYVNNGNTGGTDIIAMIVNKYRHITMGRALFLIDVLIIASAWFLPEVTRVEQLLFGLCYVFVETQAVDWVLGRGRQSVQFFIFSKEYERIADAIMTRVGRGVTFLEAEGAYTKHETKLIILVVRKSEAIKIFRIVHEIDPAAFISETPTRGVFGQGFENLKYET
ncbi:MAG: YitT family protein [Paludibacteraceae bacterium]|nr:YitT family protein [Paludibacteraceae bacterium]